MSKILPRLTGNVSMSTLAVSGAGPYWAVSDRDVTAGKPRVVFFCHNFHSKRPVRMCSAQLMTDAASD